MFHLSTETVDPLIDLPFSISDFGIYDFGFGETELVNFEFIFIICGKYFFISLRPLRLCGELL